MPRIELKIEIKATRRVVFDLSRSIDLHQISTAQTNEKAIAGKTTGLIGLHEQVTWRARHFGIYQTLTSKITAFDYPDYFVDEMVSGAFKRFKHMHRFSEIEKGTLVTEVFDYTSPWGFLGKVADVLFLERYMRNLLLERNKVIKEFAESDKWQRILDK